MENKAYNPENLYATQTAPYTLNEPIKAEIKNINDIEKGVATSSQNLNEQWGDFSSLSETVQRIKFIRKVYLILTAQLLFTFGIVSIFVLVEPIKEFVKSQTGLYLYIASYLVFITFMIFLSCNCCNSLRTVPYNYFLLGGITLTMTYMLAMISAYHKIEAVFIGIGITFFISLGITLISMQTKYDFTKNCWLFLIFFSYAVFGFGIACLISYRYVPIMQAVYGGLGALLMALFLAFDTQALIGNKRFKYNTEDYINAALQIYLDICYIFLYILQILGSKK